MRKNGRELSILILIVALSLFTWSREPHFFTVINLQNLAKNVGMYGIFSMGVALVIITSGIDLSVGSLFALLGVSLSIFLVDKGWNPGLGVAAILGISIAIGGLHSWLITKLKLQPFIVTLCGLMLYRGLAQYIAHDETKGFGSSSDPNASKGLNMLKDMSTGLHWGIPNTFWIMLLVGAILFVVLHRSVFGRHLYAVGRNEEAARFSGINTNRVVTSAYILCSFLAGISAILLAFYTNSISPSSHGVSYELYAIAASVLGGCSLRGGEGTVVGILLGTVLLQLLQNVVNMLGIPSSLNFAVVGVVILLGVIIDRMLSKQPAS